MPAAALLEEIDHAIADHLDWVMELNRALARARAPTAEELARDPHHLCRFGSWYVKNRHSVLVDQPAVHALAETHRDMHDRAHRLIARAHAGIRPGEDEHRAFAAAVGAFIAGARRLEKAFTAAAAELDALTGLRNRQSMVSELERERARALRGGRPSAVALGDIDRFKDINDTFGHAVGDAVLAAVAERFLVSLRPYDSLYRYGGEEFLFCLPDAGPGEAAAILERLRAALAARPVEVAGGQRIAVTASFGVAALAADAAVAASIERADAALYAAKQAGRDRVEMWQGGAAP